MSEFILTDLSDAVLEAFGDAVARTLVRWGQEGEGYAKDLVPVDTGNLRNSITHKVKLGEKATYIGTNSEYAAYVELGTGKYSKTGGGTPKTHWAYMGDDGEWHIGKPMKPQPYLKPAVANHRQTYKNIAQEEMTK